MVKTDKPESNKPSADAPTDIPTDPWHQELNALSAGRPGAKTEAEKTPVNPAGKKMEGAPAPKADQSNR